LIIKNQELSLIDFELSDGNSLNDVSCCDVPRPESF